MNLFNILYRQKNFSSLLEFVEMKFSSSTLYMGYAEIFPLWSSTECCAWIIQLLLQLLLILYFLTNFKSKYKRHFIYRNHSMLAYKLIQILLKQNEMNASLLVTTEAHLSLIFLSEACGLTGRWLLPNSPLYRLQIIPVNHLKNILWSY